MSEVSEKDLAEFRGLPPASYEKIRALEARVGVTIPADYKRFMLRRDGGEGFVGEHYLVLWPIEDIADLNEGYEVETYAPGLVLFGSDGAGEGFGFDTRTEPPGVVMAPFIGLSLDDAVRVAGSFDELLTRMRDSDESLF